MKPVYGGSYGQASKMDFRSRQEKLGLFGQILADWGRELTSQKPVEGERV